MLPTPTDRPQLVQLPLPDLPLLLEDLLLQAEVLHHNGQHTAAAAALAHADQLRQEGR